MALLSERLLAIAKMITPGIPVADIGCDHAYLPIYLIREAISPYVIGCDVNAGPILTAKENISDAGLSEQIELRQGDGLSVLEKGEVKSVCMAGMGGRLMMRIMMDGEDILSDVSEIILEPQSDVEALRHFLEDNGFIIISENMILEDDKFYPIIKAVHGSMNLGKEVYYRYGKILLREENPVLHEFLIKEKNYCKNLLEELKDNARAPHVLKRIEEVKKDILINEEALSMLNKPGLFEEIRELD